MDYHYNSEQLTSLIQEFKNSLETYRTSIQAIASLRDEIASSNLWIQDVVKTPFLETCNSYINYYNSTLGKLENHLNYLEKKNIAMLEVENVFSGKG